MREVDEQVCGTISGLVARLVTDGDVAGTLVWLADRCAELPGVSASAVMLADRDGALDVVAASSDVAHRLQELEQRLAEGPAHDSCDSGSRTDCSDLKDAALRWPKYAPAAWRRGVHAVHSFPMPLPGRTIGALTMFLTRTGGLQEQSLEAGQFLASTAALGIESHQATQHEIRADQLQTALDSRVLIEQAKGLLAERLGLTPAEAFEVLRQHARRTGRRLIEVAGAVLDGTLALTAGPPR